MKMEEQHKVYKDNKRQERKEQMGKNGTMQGMQKNAKILPNKSLVCLCAFANGCHGEFTFAPGTIATTIYTLMFNVIPTLILILSSVH